MKMKELTTMFESKRKFLKKESDTYKAYTILINIIERNNSKNSVVNFYKNGGTKGLIDLPVQNNDIEKVISYLDSFL